MKKRQKGLIIGGILVGIGITAVVGYSYVLHTMVPYSARGTVVEVLSYLTNKRLPGCSQLYADVWL